MVEAKLKNSGRLEGAAGIAAALGCTRRWVWMVRTGRGRSARIEAALEAAGIRVMKPRKRA